MLKDVVVPDIGSYSNVEIIEILVQENQMIEKEASLITLETDKATMEVPSPFAGKIKSIKVKVGDKISAGDLILTLEMESEEKIEKSEKSAESEKSEKSEKVEKAESKTGNNEKDKKTPVIQKVVVPDIGNYSNVSVIEVLIKAGDRIAKEASLITLETDKASMEIPSPYAGIVKEMLVKVGDTVSAGDTILTLETSYASDEASEKIEKSEKREVSKTQEISKEQERSGKQEASETSRTSRTPEVTEAPKGELPHAGPGVRRFARELGVDLYRIKGSGRNGRILQIDVQQHVKGELKKAYSGAGVSAFGAAGQAASIPGINIPPWPQIDHSQFGSVTVQPLSRIKKLSGGYLLRNWLMVPHITQFDEADITDLEKFRKESQALADEGVKLTPLGFIMKAVTATLQNFPTFNASLDINGSDLIIKKYFHIGVAVDTPGGLVVPVVRDVDQKGLFDLAKELGEISQKARLGQLKAQDMQGSSFSISSLGGIGGTGFTPIINVPDVAILGVSKAIMKPVYQDGEFVPRLMLPLSLSYDHRVIDGAEAARFCSFLVKQLSDMKRLLL